MLWSLCGANTNHLSLNIEYACLNFICQDKLGLFSYIPAYPDFQAITICSLSLKLNH
jgi:hypothetical protein